MTNHIDVKRTRASIPRRERGDSFEQVREAQCEGIHFLMPFLPVSEHFLAEPDEWCSPDLVHLAGPQHTLEVLSTSYAHTVSRSPGNQGE